ncbi:MAG: hypothetical protein WBA51_18560 [Erythrobacter sp.]
MVARFEDQDITRSELDYERRSANARGDTVSPEGMVEALVARRILASAARERGLEQDPTYHFALRRARDELLVAALRDELASTLPQPDAAEVADYIAAHRWKFADRRLVYLAPSAERAVAELVLDSASFDQAPPFPVMSVEEGDVMLWQGRAWQVLRIQQNPVLGASAQDWADAQLRNEKIDTSVEGLVGRALEEGRLQYAPGYGPSAGGP